MPVCFVCETMVLSFWGRAQVFGPLLYSLTLHTKYIPIEILSYYIFVLLHLENCYYCFNEAVFEYLLVGFEERKLSITLIPSLIY